MRKIERMGNMEFILALIIGLCISETCIYFRRGQHICKSVNRTNSNIYVKCTAIGKCSMRHTKACNSCVFNEEIKRKLFLN